MDDLSESQIKAFRLLANQSSNWAEWDEELLKLELQDLDAADYDLELTGFDTSELDAFLADFDGDGGSGEGGGLTDDDKIPDKPVTPTTKTGDVWLLGSHRLMCGDSTDAGSVAVLLAGAEPHLMVTDPPYGVDYDPDWRNQALRSDGSPSDGRAVGTVENDDRSDWRDAWELFGGDVAYVWHAGLHAQTVLDSLTACGFEPKSQIIWSKSNFAIGRSHYHWKHEPCWYAVRKGKTEHWGSDRKQTTVWDIDKPVKSETGHGTQKPVECMERPIRNNSKPGDSVYDPFSGSGTTLIAAEKTNRTCYAMEVSPAYVDVAIKRWQDFTGQTATHEATGADFVSA